ncbi:MAG: hypothetical protein DMF41_12800 [Verrucomicrobia bacterium]|nr:MAG: hypothetical protein DMF41_12800 [Verrucomicrobiota bacterium]
MANSSCNLEDFLVSSTFPTHEVMTRSRSLFRPWISGLLLTAVQLAMAIGLLAPEGSVSDRYSTLIQHDSYWFMNIVDRGYQTIVPPIDHKVMEVSNVAFFPAYPAIAAALRYGLNIDTGTALLITAQLAAWGFWSYFFLFCDRWKVSHGIVMSATRIVGIVCAAFPVIRSIVLSGWRGLRELRAWPRQYAAAIGLTLLAVFGALAFFIYCQLRWGHWDIYMLTQAAGWGISPDYLAVFKPPSYRWLIPALNNPTEASQMAMTLGALLLLGVGLCELLPATRQRTGLSTRVGIYFCAAAIYYISVSGVACVDMESMLRYEFTVHALIVLALLNFLRQFRTPPVLVRALGTAAVALVSAAGLSVQGWYVWNFTRGNWVA